LIAGIAHEINNPIAAIQSSNRNLHLTLLSDTKSPIYSEWLRFFLEEAYVKKSLEFIQIVKKNKESVTGKDRMDRRKAIEFWLIGNGLSRDLADDLIDIGIDLELILEYDSLIRYKDISTFFQLCIKEITISKCIEIIELAVERASKMTFALKNFSRYETTHTKVKFDIIENLETVITIYQNQFRKNVILHRLYSHVPLVEGYPEDLLHLWTNLIYNGLQAMEFKGEMVISVERVEGFVRITIEDSGKGIPEEIRNRIFEPFFTTKPLGEGSGLGLDISSKIIQRHNGSLDFESRPGKTKFFVSLPI
jgi:signal transduction histidine kinase